MGTRAFTRIVLASFLLFSWSCYSWQKVSLTSIRPEKREQAIVSAVQTKSGEKIDLNKNPAANILADSIVGEQFVKGIFIEKSKIETPKKLPGDVLFDLTTTDGTLYRVTFWNDMQDKILLHAWTAFSKPLSDIDFVWIRKLNVPVTVLATVAITFVSINIILAIFAPDFGEI